MANYSDGSPVVNGPFGGDYLTPTEKKMIERQRSRKRNVWWRRALRRMGLA